MTMKKGAALCVAAVMACAALAGCSKKDDSAQSGASSAATSESSTEILDNSKLTEMPDGVTLSEDQMKTTMSAYAAYMSEALAADGYTVTVRYDDDGVHFDGSKTADDGSTVEIPDLSKFDDLKSAFAYLYNCGQADAEGNLLVSTSVSAEEAAAQEAASGDADATADSEDTDSEEPMQRAPRLPPRKLLMRLLPRIPVMLPLTLLLMPRSPLTRLPLAD